MFFPFYLRVSAFPREIFLICLPWRALRALRELFFTSARMTHRGTRGASQHTGAALMDPRFRTLLSGENPAQEALKL